MPDKYRRSRKLPTKSGLSFGSLQADCAVHSTDMKLPPELEDIILSYLYDDVETLSTCSLVHRSWVISAQSRIFHRITLLLVHVERFARLLRTSPHIAQYTKVLGVQDGPRWGTEPEFAEIVSLVLPALKNVHAVALSWVNSIKLSNSAWMSFITNAPHIRSLCLNGCTFDTTPKFLSFVTAFPQLEVLELHCSGANEETTATNDNIISHSRSPLLLRRLSLDHVSSVSAIVDGLVLAEATSSLKTFQLCDSSLTVEEAASVGRLLLSAGSALEHLELSLSNTNCKPPCDLVFCEQNTNRTSTQTQRKLYL